MRILTRQLLLLGVWAVVMVMATASAVRGEIEPVVVGLVECADCTRKNMNAEAAFSGLQVAVKCKNTKGEYESKAVGVGHVDKSGAFRVPLAADLVSEDGKLQQECFAQLHSASTSAPCPGQEPSKIVAAPHGQKKTFVALAGNVHRSSSAECASAFLWGPFIHHHQVHHPALIPVPHHDPEHKPPVVDPEHKPPVVVPEHKPPVAVPEHKPPVTTVPVHEPPVTTVPVHEPPVYTPPKPTPIYHTPAERDAVNDPQLFAKLFPFLKKKPFFFKFPFFPPAAQENKH